MKKKVVDQVEGRAAIAPSPKAVDRIGELRAALERGAYDGMHGIPRGLSAQSSRTYRDAREALLFESAADGAKVRRQYRDRPVTINDALSWIEAHRAGQFDQVPHAVREPVALLASFQKRQERGERDGSTLAKALRTRIGNTPGKKSLGGNAPPKRRG